MDRPRTRILVTGFDPFGSHLVNPSQELAKAVDGRSVGEAMVTGVVLPVQHSRVAAVLEPLLHEIDPSAILHLGLAAGRARLALERVAINVMDYELPDADGYCACGEACVSGGPAAYFSTLPLAAIHAALTAAGIPAYVSNTAGTYLCNHTMYWTLNRLQRHARPVRAGFVHLPLLASMVAAAGTDEPSMDFGLMLRAVEIALATIAERLPAAAR
jgi:pyroglutamyl-peptidase